MKEEYRWLTTKGDFYDLIENGTKTFDSRMGYRDIKIGDTIVFVEADSTGKPTGKERAFRVTLVFHTIDFPKWFGWGDVNVTMIQFTKEDED